MNYNYKSIFLLLLVVSIQACITGKTGIEGGNSSNNSQVDIEVNGYILEVDQLNNIYVVSNKNSIIQYNSKRQKMFSYDSNNNGLISYINVQNPHKILVFFEAYQQLKVLDNSLSEIGEFRLSNVSNDIPHICYSNDNNVWIYDATERKIKKITTSGEILISSSPISDIVSERLNPIFMKEINNELYLYDSNNGLLIFDFVGIYNRRYLLPDKNIIDLSENTITYLTNQSLYSENYIDGTKTPLDLEISSGNLISAKKKGTDWYILTESGVITP